MHLVDDEQYYRWLRISLTLSIVLLILCAPGVKAQELELAGVKFGQVGAGLVRFFLAVAALYAYGQFAVTSWMSARNSFLSGSPPHLDAAASATAAADAATREARALKDYHQRIGELALLRDPQQITVRIGGTPEMPLFDFSSALGRLGVVVVDQLLEYLRQPHAPNSDMPTAERARIAQEVAVLMKDVLQHSVWASWGPYDQRLASTISEIERLNADLRELLSGRAADLTTAVARLQRLEARMKTLNVVRHVKFFWLENVPAMFLFLTSGAHYLGMYHRVLPSFFDVIVPT